MPQGLPEFLKNSVAHFANFCGKKNCQGQVKNENLNSSGSFSPLLGCCK